MGEVQRQKLTDAKFKGLFSDNVQFGGKTIGEGKTRMSDKWSAYNTSANGQEKYIISRQVSKSFKSHGVFTIQVDDQSIQDGKLDKKTIAKMKMLDVVATKGRKYKQKEIADIFNNYITQHDLSDISTTLENLQNNRVGAKNINFFVKHIRQNNDFQIKINEAINLLKNETITEQDGKTLRSFRVLAPAGLLSPKQIQRIEEFQNETTISAALDTYLVKDDDDREIIKEMFKALKKQGLKQIDQNGYDIMIKECPGLKKRDPVQLFQPCCTTTVKCNILDHTHKSAQLKDGRVAYLFFNIGGVVGNILSLIPYLHIAPKNLDVGNVTTDTNEGETANADEYFRGTKYIDRLGKDLIVDLKNETAEAGEVLSGMKDDLNFCIKIAPKAYVDSKKVNESMISNLYVEKDQDLDIPRTTVSAQTTTRVCMQMPEYVGTIVKVLGDENNPNRQAIQNWIINNCESMLEILSGQQINAIEKIVGELQNGQALTEGQKLVKNARALRGIFL